VKVDRVPKWKNTQLTFHNIKTANETILKITIPKKSEGMLKHHSKNK
jgi:hypothetical protein